MPSYAVDYILAGTQVRTLIVSAEDRDDAFDKARSVLQERRLFTASIQGEARPASQSDLEYAERYPEEA